MFNYCSDGFFILHFTIILNECVKCGKIYKEYTNSDVIYQKMQFMNNSHPYTIYLNALYVNHAKYIINANPRSNERKKNKIHS